MRQPDITMARAGLSVRSSLPPHTVGKIQTNEVEKKHVKLPAYSYKTKKTSQNDWKIDLFGTWY